MAIFTNFVIQKFDKKTIFLVYSRRAMHDPTKLGTVTEEIRPIFCIPVTASNLISNFSATGY